MERQIIQHGKSRYRLPRDRLRLLDRWVVDVVVAAAPAAADREVGRWRCYRMIETCIKTLAEVDVAAAVVAAVASAAVHQKRWTRRRKMEEEDVPSEEVVVENLDAAVVSAEELILLATSLGRRDLKSLPAVDVVGGADVVAADACRGAGRVISRRRKRRRTQLQM